MPVGQLFAVVGDANVRRNFTQMNIASREPMGTAKIFDCSSLPELAPALASVPGETNVCVVQCLTSILVSAADTGSTFGTIDPLLTEVNTILRDFAASRGSVQVMVAPPMFRPFPAWYRRHLPEVAHQFSTILTSNQPRNLHLLSSSLCQDLCPDGVNLTPVAGLHHLLHLFDDSQRVLSSLKAKG